MRNYSQLAKLLLLIITFGLLICQKSVSQNDTTFWKYDKQDPLWQPHSQLMKGYSLWLLRQKLSLEGNQTWIQTETDLNNSRFNKLTFVSYLPLLNSKHITFMTGTRYQMYDMYVGNENVDTRLQKLWLWTAFEYKYKRWKWILSSETHLKGNISGLYDETGNRYFGALYAGYEVNKYWNIILMGIFDHQKMEGEYTQSFKPAIQARYQPNSHFKVLFGMPTILALEWTPLNNTDIGFSYFIHNETTAFIQQRFNSKMNVSLNYSHVTDNDTYFKANTFLSANNTLDKFNNVAFTNNQLSIEAGFRTSEYIGLNLGLGYNFSDCVSLYQNTKKVNTDYYTKSFLSLNFRIQYLRF